MKKIVTGILLIALTVACGVYMQVYASLPGIAITGSKHDFKTTAYVGNGGTMFAANKCSTCHAAHKAKKNDPLWGRVDPSALSSWLVWDGATGHALDGLGNYAAAAGFVASPSGMCLSCHDGVTAMGKTAATGGTDVMIAAAANGNLGVNLSNMHPVGVKLPTAGGAGWQASYASARLETIGAGSYVGCTSCHSMHSSDPSGVKLLRAGEVCLTCHDR